MALIRMYDGRQLNCLCGPFRLIDVALWQLDFLVILHHCLLDLRKKSPICLWLFGVIFVIKVIWTAMLVLIRQFILFVESVTVYLLWVYLCTQLLAIFAYFWKNALIF